MAKVKFLFVWEDLLFCSVWKIYATSSSEDPWPCVLWPFPDDWSQREQRKQSHSQTCNSGGAWLLLVEFVNGFISMFYKAVIWLTEACWSFNIGIIVLIIFLSICHSKPLMSVFEAVIIFKASMSLYWCFHFSQKDTIAIQGQYILLYIIMLLITNAIFQHLTLLLCSGKIRPIYYFHQS